MAVKWQRHSKFPDGFNTHAANTHDSKAADNVIGLMEYKYELMSKIYADGGYRGELIDYVKNTYAWDIKITLRTDKSERFEA